MILAVASIPYGWGVRYRNRAFDCGRRPVVSVDVPVICVGNLTVGGTGKTPMVAFLCHWFRARGIRVAVVSRGYRAEEGKQNDEARELSERLPDVPHIQNPDRVAAATVAADELEMQVVVLDDGFQHRRLGRDLDLVLIDALEPFGYQRLLPRGLLREPIGGLKRAGLVALTRADLIPASRREQIREQVASVAPQAGWIELAHAPIELAAGAKRNDLSAITGKRVVAFCGLGNPAGFQQTLEGCNADVVRFLEFSDHHEYTREDLETIRQTAANLRPDWIICTHKDLVKIDIDQLGGIPLRALIVEQTILAGQPALEAKLEDIVGSLAADDAV